MNNRLLLILALLVVLPTAVLSILAFNALRSRELALEYQIASGAANAIDTVAYSLRKRLDESATKIRDRFDESMVKNTDITVDTEQGLRAIIQQDTLIKEIYLFVNPWGFIYPPGQDTNQSATARNEQVMNHLRQEAAWASGPGEIKFLLSDSAFIFIPSKTRKDLLVGYEIDQPAFNTLMFESLKAAAKGVFFFNAEGPGISEADRIVISDMFNSDETKATLQSTKPAAISRLYKPFDYIKISAYLSDPQQTIEAGMRQAQLFGWGVILLGLAVITGAWLMIRIAALEIKNARARGDYVIGVSHDLRTPIASVKMLSESMLSGNIKDYEKREKFLAMIVAESDNLSRMIERVLYFVRYGQHALVFNKREVDIEELVREAITMIKPRQTAGKQTTVDGRLSTVDRQECPIKLSASSTTSLQSTSVLSSPSTVNCPPSADSYMVTADRPALLQVFLNLIDNALKYSVSEQAKHDGIRIRIGSREPKHGFFGIKQSYVTIAVTDSGIGIARKDRKKIFRDYYRTKEARALHLSGVGLGLALCKEIIESHGGMIELQSEPDKGSTFTVILPNARTKI